MNSGSKPLPIGTMLAAMQGGKFGQNPHGFKTQRPGGVGGSF